MKRETVEGETYLGLNLFRFYFKCPNCLAEITFKTDLENCDYQNEFGATRLFEAFKLYKESERAKEAQEEEDKKDPMKMLEKRTMMSRAEMEAMGDLEDLQDHSRHKEGVDVDVFLSGRDANMTLAQKLKRQEELDEEYIRTLYGKQEDGKIVKRLADIEDDLDEEVDEKPGTSGLQNDSELPDRKPVDLKPSFGKDPPAKRGADQKSLLSKLVIVKKKKTEPDVDIKQEATDNSNTPTSSISSSSASSSTPSTLPQTSVAAKPAVGLLGLADYGSGSDSD